MNAQTRFDHWPSRVFATSWRRGLIIMAIVIVASSAAATAFAGDDDKRPEPGSVFDRVVSTLEKRLYDNRVRTQVLPALAEKYRNEAVNAATLDDERRVIEQMLAHLPFSHLGLLSARTHAQMTRNLAGEKSPTVGFELVQIDGDYFVQGVLEQGPADTSGLKRGDRVIRIDGEIPAMSSRLDWRSDDAALADPPSHGVLCENDDRITLEVQRTADGEAMTIEIAAREDSAFDAARRSAAVIDVDGHKIAYIHFWYVHTRGPDTLLTRLFSDEFKDADALVLDLRGRGGNAQMVMQMLRTLAGRKSKWNRPVVALIDRNTRSAKEMLAWELRNRKMGVLVGETTAGALLPAVFADVGGDSVLMYPAFALGKYTEEIEGKGVPPDVQIDAAGPYSAGADPIREAGLKKAAELAIEHAKKTAPVN